MKANFLNLLIPILLIVLIILGMIPGMSSALDMHSYSGYSRDSYSRNSDTGSSDTGSSDTGKSDTGKSDTGKSDTGSLDTGKSDTGKSDTGSLDTGKSDTGKSDTGKSDTRKPDTRKPDTRKPDTRKPDTGKSDTENSSTGSSDTGTSNTINSHVLNSSNENSSDLNSSNINSSNLNSDNLNSSNVISGNVNSNEMDSGLNSSNFNSSTSNSFDEESRGGGSSSSSSSNSGMELFYREPATNVVAKELAARNVINGDHIRYDFSKNVTCIMYIEYDAERTFLKTTTVVEELKNKSTFVPELPSGIIYRHVNVLVGDKVEGLPTSLENGLIGFKVGKSWINDNNINESLVTLQRYNQSWEPLYTEKVGEDNNYSYFTSKTPGFSFFAITAYTGEADKNETQIGAKLQDILVGSLEGTGKVALNGSENKSKAQEAREVAKTLMAIILPLFLICVGYLVVKKKI